MKKEIKVYALPTKKASNIKFIPKGEYDEIDGKLIQTTTDRYLYIEKATKFGYPSTFLYVITNETPEIGDWVIVDCSEIEILEIRLITGYYNEQFLFDDKSQIHMDYCKKVIATNDNDLHFKAFVGGVPNSSFDKPFVHKISPEFQQAWVKSINENVPIVKALMEFNEPVCKCDTQEELWKCPFACNGGDECTAPNPNNDFYGLRPKINSQGYVTILPKLEKMYSREEVLKFLYAFKEEVPIGSNSKFAIKYSDMSFEDRQKEWIKQNL